MNAPDNIFLPDEQSKADLRNIAIQRVGVRALRHPIIVDSLDGPLPTVALIDMAVFLPATVKGTHMSRFLEVLQNHEYNLNTNTVKTLMNEMLWRLESTAGTITIRFPYFIRKVAPASGVASLMDYEVLIEIDHNEKQNKVTLQVTVPVTSLCPCSKKISAYGAHNQRSHITIRAVVHEGLAADDLIHMAEASASCELWGLLKRSDEKFVTEYAYNNPKFVEDLVRDVALRLRNNPKVQAYRIDCENFESIHNHSAVAWIEEFKNIDEKDHAF